MASDLTRADRAWALVLAVGVCLLAAGSFGCRESSKESSPAVIVSEAPEILTEPEAPTPKEQRNVAGAGAFDLAAADDGALLAWSPPQAEGSGILVQWLDVHGVPRSAAQRVAQTDATSEVLELAVTALYGRAGVVWVESSEVESRTRSLVLTPGAPARAAPARLAVGPAGQASGRMRVALGRGRGETLRAMYATQADDCGRGSSEVCSGYAFAQLGDDDARGVGGEWLRVPLPCPDVAPMLGGATGELYYAVCSDADGVRTTTAFSVDLNGEYARAVPVLQGCTPRGLVAPLWGAAWVVGRCAEGMRAVELTTNPNRGVQEHALDGLRATCADGKITLRAGELSLPLTQPLDGLEALLPPKLSPEDAVAAFTGHTLLVARADNHALQLERYICRDGTLALAP